MKRCGVNATHSIVQFRIAPVGIQKDSAKGHNGTNKKTLSGKDRRIRSRTGYFLSAAGGVEVVVGWLPEAGGAGGG